MGQNATPQTLRAGPLIQIKPDSAENFYGGFISPDVNNVSLQPIYRRLEGRVFYYQV